MYYNIQMGTKFILFIDRDDNIEDDAVFTNRHSKYL